MFTILHTISLRYRSVRGLKVDCHRFPGVGCLQFVQATVIDGISCRGSCFHTKHLI